MDGLSCSIWRRAELFQQVADARLKPAAYNNIPDVKSIFFISRETKETLCSGSNCSAVYVAYTVVNVDQMQTSILEILTLPFTVSKGKDCTSVFGKSYLF